MSGLLERCRDEEEGDREGMKGTACMLAGAEEEDSRLCEDVGELTTMQGEEEEKVEEEEEDLR